MLRSEWLRPHLGFLWVPFVATFCCLSPQPNPNDPKPKTRNPNSETRNPKRGLRLLGLCCFVSVSRLSRAHIRTSRHTRCIQARASAHICLVVVASAHICLKHEHLHIYVLCSAPTHTHTHTRTHTRTHTCARAHTHTRIHTRARLRKHEHCKHEHHTYATSIASANVSHTRYIRNEDRKHQRLTYSKP